MSEHYDRCEAVLSRIDGDNGDQVLGWIVSAAAMDDDQYRWLVSELDKRDASRAAVQR